MCFLERRGGRCELAVPVRRAAIAAPTYARRLACFFDNRERHAHFAALSRRTTHGFHVALGHVFFAATTLARALGLVFCLFEDTVCCVLL